MIRYNITVPVCNEQDCLARTVQHLLQFLEKSLDGSFEVVIAENGSTDDSPAIACQLAAEWDCVRVIHLPERGRGAALVRAWAGSSAPVLSYMDADLSSDIAALPSLLGAVARREADLAVGSRLVRPASTRRGFKREIISRTYAFLVRALFHARFSDPQCGFKVISREAALSLLPSVRDTGWFFDTELLVLAERAGWRILDVPVAWAERKRSHVKILPTVLGDIKGLLRLYSQVGKTAAGRQGSLPVNDRATPPRPAASQSAEQP